jgi:plastocyanin
MRYEYPASPVHVKVGTKVQLEITAIDHDHGFKIGSVPDGASSGDKIGLVFISEQECWQLKKGETTVIEFLAQTPGTYTFKCCHTCGLGHKGMKGQIVVEPWDECCAAATALLSNMGPISNRIVVSAGWWRILQCPEMIVVSWNRTEGNSVLIIVSGTIQCQNSACGEYGCLKTDVSVNDATTF